MGQAFARLLLDRREQLRNEYRLTFAVTGICTGRHGSAVDPQGLDLEHALRLAEAGESLDALSIQPAPRSALEFIRQTSADVLFENTPVNHSNGQPAIDHLRAGLQGGMHVITANKGPVAHSYQELTDLATSKDRRFLFESAVMDGAPIFSLARSALPAARVLGFRGILNSCTNYILERMEGGAAFERAVENARAIGITETDPSADIDGWDAAIKTAILATVLIGSPVSPQQVERQGIRGISPADIRDAQREGKRWKLICSAGQEGGRLAARVTPEKVAPDSPLYAVNGTSSFVQLILDVLPGLGILESDPGPETTAYGLLADFLTAVLQEKKG